MTIFYGWVTENEPGRDPCLCGSPGCRGSINFDVSDADATHADQPGPEGDAVRRRLEEYSAYLRSVGQEQVVDTVSAVVRRVQRRLRAG